MFRTIKNKIYYNKMDKIDFHDGIISKYEKKDNNIILEFEDGYHRNFTTRLTFIDASIDNEENINHKYILHCDYDIDDNNIYHTTFDICSKKVTINSKKVKIEQFITSEIYEKYIIHKKIYIKNLKKISKRLDKTVLEKINKISDIYAVKDYHHHDNDLLIEFKRVVGETKFKLRLIDCSIKILKNNQEITGKEKTKLLEAIYKKDSFKEDKSGLNFEKGFWKFRFCEAKDDNLEVGIYISNDTEVVITCKDIK